jgi:hypothetical protein
MQKFVLWGKHGANMAPVKTKAQTKTPATANCCRRFHQYKLVIKPA